MITDSHTPIANEKSGTVVMGGTFDPIHHGHLRSAVDILDFFRFKTLRMVPCFQPVHKDHPSVTPEQRLQMVELGIQADIRLEVDPREILREGPSYTKDTLQELRDELGEDEPIIMVVGMDSFLSLPTWAEWQSLLDVAHILVISRPGWEPDFISSLEEFYEKHRAQNVAELQWRALRKDLDGKFYAISDFLQSGKKTMSRERIDCVSRA